MCNMGYSLLCVLTTPPAKIGITNTTYNILLLDSPWDKFKEEKFTDPDPLQHSTPPP